MESPPFSINNAEPSTTSNAAAVIISRSRVLANILNKGLSNQIPITTKVARESAAILICCQTGRASSTSIGARKVITANSGTINKSSKSKIETIFCPRSVPISPRSLNVCITIAVDVITKPQAPTNAICHG